MKVDVNAVGVAVEPGVREMAERAVLLALGPFAPTLSGVRVRIGEAGLAGLLPGARYTVMLRVESDPGFLVIERDAVLASALRRAAQRARRSLDRLLSRASFRDAAAAGERATSARLSRRRGRVIDRATNE